MRISDWSSDVCASDLSDTPKQTVETDLLFRAAELTLKSGYDYFVFASDSTDASTRYLQSFDGFYGGWGPYYWGPSSAFGGGFGASTSKPITEYVAQTNVVKIGRAHVSIPVTNEHHVCRLQFKNKNNNQSHYYHEPKTSQQ